MRETFATFSALMTIGLEGAATGLLLLASLAVAGVLSGSSFFPFVLAGSCSGMIF